MKKKYTKKQILESIKYWEKQLNMMNESYDYSSFFKKEGIYGAFRIDDLKSFGKISAFVSFLYFLTNGNGVYALSKAMNTNWGIGLIEVAKNNGFTGTDEDILEDILDYVWEGCVSSEGDELVERLTQIDNGQSLKNWIRETCGMRDVNWIVTVDGIGAVPITSIQFSNWMENGDYSEIDFSILDKKYKRNPLKS